MNNVSYLVTKDNVTIFKGGKTHIVGRQYSTFDRIVEALKAQDFDGAFDLADRATSITKDSEGVFTVENGTVFRNGLPVHNVITKRILQFQEEGLPFEPLVKFLENLVKNPSARSVTELYKFLEHKFLPITDDGCFLAYKAVQNDYLSITSGTTEVKVTDSEGERVVTGQVPNNVGNILEVDRNQVDDDATRTCSFGLHAGSLEYAKDFGGSGSRTVVIKINPRDAVSVPVDADAQKLRASRYEVIADFVAAIEEASVDTEVVRTPTLVNSIKLKLSAKYPLNRKTAVATAINIIRHQAKKHLKLRSALKASGKVNGSMLELDLTIPLDTRYKKRNAENESAFTSAWQKRLSESLNIASF